MLCSISGVRLVNTALYTFRHLKISSALFSFWLEFAGPIDFDGKQLTDDEITTVKQALSCNILGYVKGEDIDEIKRLFYQHMFTLCIEKLLHPGWSFHEINAIVLSKIIVCASIQHDAFSTIVYLNHFYWSCRYFMEDTSISEETYDNLSEVLDIIQLAYTSITSDDSIEAFIASMNILGKPPSNQNISASLLLQALLNIQ